MPNTLFTNVQILDGTGAEPHAGEVLVQGNRIKQIGKDGNGLPHGDAELVDGGGATLMPGLVESHSHISFLDTPDLESLGFVPPEEHTLRSMKNARKLLDQGFTSCNSAAAAKPRLDVRHRCGPGGRRPARERYLVRLRHLTFNMATSGSNITFRLMAVAA